MIQFDPRTFRYRSLSTGRFTTRAELLRLLDSEVNRLEVRLKGHARLLTSNRIDLPEFQRRMAHDIKIAHVRTSALGAGGVKQLDAVHFGATGQQLRVQYGYLGGFGNAIASGKLTEKQIITRSSSYASSVRVSFHKSEAIARRRNGFAYARRLLDSQSSRHCASCLRHSTNGKYVPIEQIVAIGSNCECKSRCRCFILWKKN